ncbi:MAG: UbiA family prenyltransferase, partial [Acidobacteria bacterium]|nr:UbiA family prenyltransferase [Acidobacteriota bacterium]
LSRLKGLGKPVYSFDRSIGFMSSLIRLIRPHQWVKNLLLFVPLFAAHRLNEPNLIWGCLACFFAQSLIASAGYILNDLLDAHADRAHPIKRNRPLAAGSFPVPQAMFLMLFCLILGFVLAGLTPSPPYLYLCLYFLLSLSYSLYFKRKLMIDVMVLAGLYTLRIIMGGEATGILVSPWLLAFSMFLFLSLAFLKRAGELLLWTENKVLPNRAYQREDLDIVLNLGPSSGMMAVLVFALYVSNEETHRLYHRQEWLWLVCPLLIYWIARMWFKARRGEIPSDPVLFALKDPASLLCGLSVLACMWLAI